MWSWPFCMARERGPTLYSRLGNVSAPCTRSNSTISAWPRSTAQHSGVRGSQRDSENRSQETRGGFLESARCLLDQDAVDTDSWLLDDPRFSALPWPAAHCHQEIVGLFLVQVDYIHLASQGDNHFFRLRCPTNKQFCCVAATCGKLTFVKQLFETHHYDANTWQRGEIISSPGPGEAP